MNYRKPFTAINVARSLDCSTRRVHQLEEAGVLLAVRTESGIRIFDPEQVEAVRLQRKERKRTRG
jgi:DNA-binding transcriptional MerR regulator